MKKLTKEKALHLLPLIIDNVASDTEKDAFFHYLETDPEIKKKYESLLFVKQLLKTKYSKAKAPDHLKKKILESIQDIEWEKGEKSKVDNSSSSIQNYKTGTHKEHFTDQKKSPLFNVMKPARYLIAASVIFFFSLVTIEFLEKVSSSGFNLHESIEQIAMSHFHSGNHVESAMASFQPASFDHASELLEKEMAHTPRMPTVEGADLKNIYYSSFSSDYSTPVFEFHQEEINEHVYIFAFKIDDLEKSKRIERDPEAVKKCLTYDDYYISDIDGKHVVSWKWGDYWYTAVSNHNGNDLIALVEPLKSEWGEEESSSGW